MANTIVHKKSSEAGKVPLTTDLVAGELAVNTADGKAFLKKDDNSIVEIGGDITIGPDDIITDYIADGAVTDAKLDGPRMNLTGGTVTGDISGAFPTDDAHLVRKDYVDSVASGTKALATKSVIQGEEISISLLSSTPVAKVIVQKEISGENATNQSWILGSDSYTSEDTAYNTTLTPNGNKDIIFITLGSGAFTTDDIGKTIYLNGGSVGLIDITGEAQVIELLDNISTASSGNWTMYDKEITNDYLGLSSFEKREFNILNYNTTYNSITYDVSAFNNDGTLLFFKNSGSTPNIIFEYSLSTPYDITTLVATGKTFDLSFASAMYDLSFDITGTLMYLTYYGGSDIYMYNLSIPFDISTISYSGRAGVGSESGRPAAVIITPDGTKMFVKEGNSLYNIYEYNLSTPYDITTFSYSGNNNNLGNGAMCFNANGSKLYVGNDSNINEFGLTTPFDLSTLFSTGVTITSGAGYMKITNGTLYKISNSLIYQLVSPSTRISVNNAVTTTIPASQINALHWDSFDSLNINDTGLISHALSSDNKQTWIAGSPNLFPREIVRNNTGTWEYNNSEPNYDISGSYTDTSPSIIQYLAGLVIANNGKYAYVTESSNDRVFQYKMTTPYDISTISYVSYYDTGNTLPNGVALSPDGNYMYVTLSNNVYEYRLAIPYMVNTATPTSNKSLNDMNFPKGLTLNEIGTKMFIVDSSTDRVYEYNLSTPYRISSMSYSGKSVYIGDHETVIIDLAFNSGGTKMYIVGSGSDNINEYKLSRNYDLSSAIWFKSRDITESGSNAGIDFSEDGTKMYKLGYLGSIVEYNTANAVSDNWTAAITNTMNGALIDSVTIGANIMTSTNASNTDFSGVTLGNTLDVGVVMLESTNQSKLYSVDMEYTATVRYKTLTPNIHYEYYQEVNNEVIIRHLESESANYKIRVI